MMHPGEEEKGAAPTAGTSSQIRDCDIIIGVRIRTLRETRKQTQKGLAEACGISRHKSRNMSVGRTESRLPVYWISQEPSMLSLYISSMTWMSPGIAGRIAVQIR